MNKKQKIVVVFMLCFVMLFAFVACTNGNGNGNSIETESYIPAFNLYDYYADVYGLTANPEKTTGTNAGQQKYFLRYNYNKYGEDLPGEPATNQTGKYFNYAHPFKTVPYTAFSTFLVNADTGTNAGGTPVNRRSDEAMGIINSSGDYLFFFGGAHENKTKTAITAFNDVLAEVYLRGTNDTGLPVASPRGDEVNFFTSAAAPFVHVVDFNVGGLEGDDIFDIRTDQREYGGSGSNPISTITKMYKDVIDRIKGLENFAPALSEKKVSVKIDNVQSESLFINSPSIMIIRKDTTKTVATGLNTVIDFIDASNIDFNNTTSVDQYKNDIKDLLKKDNGSDYYKRPQSYETLSGNGGTKGTVDPLALRVYDFATDGFARYAGDKRNGPSNTVLAQPLLTPVDLSQSKRINMFHRFSFMTYNEYLAMMNSQGSYAVLVANQGCPYFGGTIRNLDYARAGASVPMIYHFDMCLDGANGGPMNIRNMDRVASATGNVVARLYPKMLENYGENVQGFAFYGDSMAAPGSSVSGRVEIGGKVYLKLAAPHFILFNKDNVDIYGDSKPVLAVVESGPDHRWTRVGGSASGDPDEFAPLSQGKRAEFFYMFNEFKSGNLSYRIVD